MINEIQAKKYCSEDINKIDNYEKAIVDNTTTWDCHHKREISENKSKTQLIAENLYDNRPANELIFLTRAEHRRLHMFKNTNRRGKHHSTEAKEKMSEAKLGEKHPFYGKHHSEETKQQMREAKLGQLFWNNGVINKRSKDCPGPEWKRGRL